MKTYFCIFLVICLSVALTALSAILEQDQEQKLRLQRDAALREADQLADRLVAIEKQKDAQKSPMGKVHSMPGRLGDGF
jgi:hypothetical protein